MAGLKVKTKTKEKAPAGSKSRVSRDRSEDEDMIDATQWAFDPQESDASEASKDETEKTLEKLVFGDDEGFIQSLKNKSSSKGKELVLRPGAEDDESVADEEDLSDVADEDLFFLDSGPGTVPSGLSAALKPTTSADEEDNRTRHATWWDSDDDRIVVSLASNPRLRKLRNTEGEDVIDGREYIKRLRMQYERLHPRPAWADGATQTSKRSLKRRRSSAPGHDASGSDSDPDIGSENELDQVQTRPLAELLRSADSLIDPARTLKSSPFKLRPEVIDIHRLKDVTSSSPSAITTLSFHEQFPILLATAGPASTVFLHHISPQSLSPNPLLTSLLLKKTPLHNVEFRPSRSKNLPNPSETNAGEDSTQIFLSSRRRYIHTWQLTTGRVTRHTRPIYGNKAARSSQRTLEAFRLSPCGRYVAFIGSSRKGGGIINVLDASTMQWLCACRVEGRGGIADFAWWRDGNGLVVLSKSGEVSEFSVEERRILARWIDEGNVGPTVIIVGGRSGQKGGLVGSDRWVITGSTSGIVNIYNRSAWGHPPVEDSSASLTGDASNASVPPNPSPTRMLDQLTTPISSLTLSPDGQLLIISSRWKKDALRLVHLPSCTVYRNWPTASTPLGRISSVAVTGWGGSARNSSGSEGGGLWLCVGNEKGRVGMWEIRA